MFIDYPLAGNPSILAFLLLGKRMFLAAFLRYLTVGMELVDSLVPRIGLGLEVRMQFDSRLFIQPKIMPFAIGHIRTDDLHPGTVCSRMRSFGNHDLALQRVALFLAGVIPLLFFLGRSIGVSEASIKMTR